MKKIQVITLIVSFLSSASGKADLKSGYQLVYHPVTQRSSSQSLCLTVSKKPLGNTYLRPPAPPFEVILFDADDTLFHYDTFNGLKIMFRHHGKEFNEQDFDRFMKINKSLWIDYQNGTITADDLQEKRFESFASELSISAQTLSDEYINTMVEISTPIEGVVNLLRALKGKAKLAIVTNGFARLQKTRLEKSGFQDFFDLLITTEEVGSAKPNRAIFDLALSKLGAPIRDRVLMVGDSLEFDIQGGNNAGIKTCWFNNNKKPSNGINPDYQVSSFKELETLLNKTIQKD